MAVLKRYDCRAKLPEKLKKKLTAKQYTLAPVTVKKFDPDKPMEIEAIANGIAADRGKEVMPKDCWDLTNFQKNPIVLYEHKYENPVGFCTEIEPSDDGLHVRFVLGDPSQAPLTPLQVTVRSLVAQGILRGLSVGFIPRVIEYDEENDVLRYIEVELLEFSIVAVPMQQDSLITAVKHWRETVTTESTDKGAPTIGDVHAKCKDMHDDVKAIHKMVKDMSDGDGKDDDGDNDSKKSLRQRIKGLEAQLATTQSDLASARRERDDWKKKHDEIETETKAFLDDLTKQGVIKAQ